MQGRTFTEPLCWAVRTQHSNPWCSCVHAVHSLFWIARSACAGGISSLGLQAMQGWSSSAAPGLWSPKQEQGEAQWAIGALGAPASSDTATSMWVVISCVEVMVTQRAPDQAWAGAFRTSISVLTTSKPEYLDPTAVASFFQCHESHCNNGLNALHARHPNLWSQFGLCSLDSSLWKFDFHSGKKLWPCS